MTKAIMPFRFLSPRFFQDLKEKSNNLSFILDFEKKNRGLFIVEIRKNFLDVYFLGHGIEVKKKLSDGKYRLIASNKFNPKYYLPSESLKKLVRDYGDGKWQIILDQIENYEDFEVIMSKLLSRIVEHRKGKISEGVSEINHFVDNRDIKQNGILVVDRQIVYPGIPKKIDLLGVRRLSSNKYTFAIIELKNKNSVQIGQVFSQIREYIDLVFDKYDDFVKTYRTVIRQKIDLGLLKRIYVDFAKKREIAKTDIEGVAILDNFNIRSDLKKNGLLKRALDDWIMDDSTYCLKLFLKTNVLDSTFFYNYRSAVAILRKYILKNIRN